MKRIYSTGESASTVYFFGQEVEHTPAYMMDTLFVVGVRPVEEITTKLESHISHIFFGANHSFNPASFEEWHNWKTMISHFLEKGYVCSLDIPMSAVEEFHDSGLCDFNNFIPQIRVPIPYIKLWNYNTMIKIDDKDFDASNPGVWSHSLQNLMNREQFTGWNEYHNDQIIL